jgi:ADP-heptose:LPS heptosyltransferase
MKLPKFLKLHLEGGIGDCIKVITCSFPLQSLYDNYGIRTFVTYGGEHYNDCGWGNLLREELFNESKALIYLPPTTFEDIIAPTASDFFRQPKPFSLDLEKLLPLNLGNVGFIPQKNQRNIGIQFDSNDERKKFKPHKWKQLIERILKAHENTQIYIFGAPSEKKTIDDNTPKQDRIHNTAGNPLSESINIISQMDLFITPDSFPKYICLCSRVPAIILCSELSYISVKDMLKTCFNGIANNDNYKILGLGDNPVQDINEIKVEEIFKHVR